MIKGFKQSKRLKKEGQSMVEFGLVLPLLLLLVASMVEFGFLMNHYLAVLDSTRNASRFSSDSLYNLRDGNTNCDPTAGPVTQDFYLQTACIVIQELSQERPTITIDVSNGDDILVSSIAITGGASPAVSGWFPVAGGWSYAAAMSGSRNQVSRFTNANINAMLRANTPNTGFVIVELFHHYNQRLRLPWITAFLPDPVLFYSSSVMPLVSAEPTPTPEP
jgi:hypothetical protein